MRQFAAAILTIMMIGTGCAAGIVSDDRVVGVASGDSELSSGACQEGEEASPTGECNKIEGGQLSEAVANALKSVVGAVGGIVGGIRGIFGGLFGGDDSSD